MNGLWITHNQNANIFSILFFPPPTIPIFNLMGLNYNLGDKSKNLRRMNHFKNFNKADRNFFAENARFVLILCAYFGVKDWS